MIRFPDLIRRNAQQVPDKIATHFEGHDQSWAAYNARIHAMAQSLRDLGLPIGGRVAYLGLNSHWLAELYFAPALIGGIIVPMNYRLSEDEMVTLLDDCTPTILVTDRHYTARAKILMQRCPSLKHLILADWEASAEMLNYEALITQAGPIAEDSFDALASSGDDTMLLIYTSGTTGQPKGAMLSHANMLANAMGTAPHYGYTAQDRILLPGPLFHIATGARIHTSVLYGTPMIIQAKFDVAGMMDLIQSQRATTMTVVPTMLQMVLDHPRFAEFDFSSLRCITYGSAPMPLALMHRLLEALPDVTFAQGYGMSEASPILTILPPEYHTPLDGAFPKLASIGLPMPYCDLRIVDAEDQPVGLGETGELIVRGPQVMQGYWNRPDETAQAMRGGFYHTGDAGYVDEDGFVYLAGRTKEMIISGGENVYPIETENCLAKHPAVGSVAVIGLPDAHWGEIVCAVVSLKSAASPEELIAYSREKIAHYKAPKVVHVWDGALPLSPANKIDKLAIKAALLEDAKSV